MKNRIIPYGYRIEDGKVTIYHEEAAIVKEIYEKRAAGVILSDIAASLNDRGIPFYGELGWDKHKVKRLLENDKYLGMDGHPAILDQQIVDNARSFQYYAEVNRNCHPSVHLLKSRVLCAKCESKVNRKVERNRKQPVVWICQCCGAILPITDETLLQAILEGHRELKNGLSEMKSGSPFPIPAPPSLKLLEDRLHRQLHRQDADAQDTLAMIREWAAEKYETLKDEVADYTERLVAILEKTSLTEYDDALTERIVRNIILAETGAITVRYRNGMEITEGKESGNEPTGKECDPDPGEEGKDRKGPQP